MKVLVVAAHPDDEVLGVGGTIAKHIDDGDDVVSLIVAEGETARLDTLSTNSLKAEAIKLLRTAAFASAQKLGYEDVRFLSFPDQRLDTVSILDITQKIEKLIDEIRPEIIYTHHYGDLNQDHKVVHQATVTAARPVPGCSVKIIRTFETLSSTEWGLNGNEFSPDTFVAISEQVDRKQEALLCYDVEMRPFPHARSLEAVKAQGVTRGASVGVEAAEAFVTIRNVIE